MSELRCEHVPYTTEYRQICLRATTPAAPRYIALLHRSINVPNLQKSFCFAVYRFYRFFLLVSTAAYVR